jgi:nickel-dependent lactate racemase
MQKVDRPFEVVVTTNSGYPLDMNLYQGVKGMSAGARVLAQGGTLILAAECSEGVPAGSPFDKLLREGRITGGDPRPARHARLCPTRTVAGPDPVADPASRQGPVYSSMPADVLRAAHLTPCTDIAAAVRQELERFGPESRVAVLPQGPLTIPYIA